MKKIALFCGSRFDKQQQYFEPISDAVKLLAHNYEIIYGGSNTGYMKVVAESVKAVDGYLVGIMPAFLKDKELAFEQCDEFIEVSDMSERKKIIFEKADGFIALPGGLGTFEEVIDVLSWAQIGLIKKPIGFFNPNHYYDSLIEFINQSIEDGFIEESFKNLFFVSDDMSVLIKEMEDSDFANQEVWDLYDKDRNPLASTIFRSHYSFIKDYQYHLVVFLIIKDGDKVLLQKRSSTKELFPNQWDVSVGGSVLAFENSIQGIIRETQEELGLLVNENELQLVDSFRDDESQSLIDVYQMNTSSLNIEELIIPNEEVSEVAWFNKEEIAEMIEKGQFVRDWIWKWNLIKLD